MAGGGVNEGKVRLDRIWLPHVAHYNLEKSRGPRGGLVRSHLTANANVQKGATFVCVKRTRMPKFLATRPPHANIDHTEQRLEQRECTLGEADGGHWILWHGHLVKEVIGQGPPHVPVANQHRLDDSRLGGW
eukprot:scaffold70438_cov23-Tisochrysis_lutea.AAC.2